MNELKEMCTVITPYICPKCGRDLLSFAVNDSNTCIRYKGLIDSGHSLRDIKHVLLQNEVKYMICMGCGRKFIMDWRNGFPIPVIDKAVLEQFGYGLSKNNKGRS